jgi:hypothetical protein
MFVRTGRNKQLTQGPPGPDVPYPRHTDRQLFPSPKRDEIRSPTPEIWTEDGRTTEQVSDTQSTPAPNHCHETAKLLKADPTPDPLELTPGLLSALEVAAHNPERPSKRQKIEHTAENDIPVAGSIRRVEEPPANAERFALEADSERKAFIKKFGAEKGLTVPVLEAIWTARKHGYHKPYDAPFAKFRAFFDAQRPLCPFRPDTIQPGDVIGFLRHMHDEGSNHGSIKDASASISTAISQATDGAINIGKKESVIAYLKSVRIHQPVGPRRKRIPDGYGDVARLYEEAWNFGPNDALCNRHLQDKLVLLLMLDTAARPSDLHALYRVTEGSQRQILFNGKDMQIRYFYSKEVDPGSARQNSSNTYFSSWVPVFGTTPIEINTVDVMKDFLRRTTDAQLYQQVHVPQLQQVCQPLVFSTSRQGKLKAASVDYISHVVRDAMIRMGMNNMQTAHLRGASTSKVVQLVPTAEAAVMKLGRWTTPYTFRNHYQAPVQGTWDPVPEQLQKNTQMILRWGFR